MRALVYTAPGRLELQELPTPVVRPGEALVRIRAVGVCGSDLDGFLGRSKKRAPPLVLGHEFCGEVAATGEGVSGFRVGDAVAVYPLIACGACRYCESGRHQICPQKKVYGLDLHGALAEYVSAPSECLFRMPKEMTFCEGALIEPLANALHVLGRLPRVEGQTGLIYGAGPIGLMVFWAAKHFGARRVAVVDLNPYRLSLLKNLGADLVVEASEQDPLTALLEWTGGLGVDFAVDAVGQAACRQNTIACTASGGTVVWIGLSGETCEINGRAVVTREIEIKGSYAYGREDFSRALSILAKKTFPSGLVVREAVLEEGQAIFEELTRPQTRLMKAVFTI